MITLLPMGALCNRLRAINAAIGLSRDLNTSLRVLWFKKRMHAPFMFSDIFQNIENVCINENQLNNITNAIFFAFISKHKESEKLIKIYLSFKNFDYIIDHLGYKIITEKEKGSIKEYKNIFVRSSVNFYKNYDFSSIKPHSKIIKSIKENTKKFNKNTIGIHIRRGDRLFSTYGSPTYLFEEKLNKYSKNNFYLASDDHKTKEYFIKKYGERILTLPKKPDRISLEGSIDSVIDLYSLARTTKIYGSYASSYSEVASQIGNIPLEILSTPEGIQRGVEEEAKLGRKETKEYMIKKGLLPKYTRWMPWIR